MIALKIALDVQMGFQWVSESYLKLDITALRGAIGRLHSLIHELDVTTRTNSNASWRPQLHTIFLQQSTSGQENRQDDYHQLLQRCLH